MKRPSKKSDTAASIALAGRTLYGDRWQSPLSRVSGVAQNVLSNVTHGDPDKRRPLKPEIARLIVDALAIEARRLGEAKKEVGRLRREIAASIPKE